MYGRSKNMLRHIKTSYTLESESKLQRALKKTTPACRAIGKSGPNLVWRVGSVTKFMEIIRIQLEIQKSTEKLLNKPTHPRLL